MSGGATSQKYSAKGKIVGASIPIGTGGSESFGTGKQETGLLDISRLTPRSNYFYKPKEKPEGE